MQMFLYKLIYNYWYITIVRPTSISCRITPDTGNFKEFFHVTDDSTDESTQVCCYLFTVDEIAFEFIAFAGVARE